MTGVDPYRPLCEPWDAFQPFVSLSATLLKNEIRTTGFDYRSEFLRETKTSSRLSRHPHVTPNSLIPQTKKGIPPSKEQSRLGKLPHHPLSSPIRPTCIAPIKMAGRLLHTATINDNFLTVALPLSAGADPNSTTFQWRADRRIRPSGLAGG